MTGEKRKNPRRFVTYPAFLDLGDDAPPRECLLCDVSKGGALLAVTDPESLPDEFTLALSTDGAARRRCKVMWRETDQVGVAFVKDFNSPVRPLDVSHAGAEIPTEAQGRDLQGDEAAGDSGRDAFDIDTLT